MNPNIVMLGGGGGGGYTGITVNATTDNYIIDDGTSAHYFRVAGPVGETFKVDWGDGTTSEITFLGITLDQRIAKTYPTAGTYNLTITGWDLLTRITFINWNAGNMSINGISSGITFLNLSNLGTNLTGSINNLSSVITTLILSDLGTNLTGSIDNLTSALTYLYMDKLGTNLSGSLGSLNNLITYIKLYNCGNNFDLTTNLKAFDSAYIQVYPQSGYGYTTAQIDAFLNAYDAVAGNGIKTIDLRGANQPRSSASDAAVASLTSKGRNILTNP